MKFADRLDVNQKLWSGIHSIQEQLKINDHVFSQKAGMNWEKFIFCKQNNLSLPFHHLENLSHYLSISVDSLLRGEVDHRLEKTMFENLLKNHLNERYQIGEGSKTLTLRHLIKLAKNYNIHQQVMEKFSLPPILVEAKIDLEISAQLVADIVDYMCQLVTITDEDLKEIAELNAFYFKDTAFGKLLKSCQTPIEVYENLVFLTSFLENNWYYKIEKYVDGKVYLNSYPSERLTETFKRKDYSSYNFLRFRVLVTGVLMRYIGLTDAETQITKSVHRGDDYCQFLIDTKSSRPLSETSDLYLQ